MNEVVVISGVGEERQETKWAYGTRKLRQHLTRLRELGIRYQIKKASNGNNHGGDRDQGCNRSSARHRAFVGGKGRPIC